jgi:hypothetical protein
MQALSPAGLADSYGNRESASPTRSVVDKSEWSKSRFSRVSGRFATTLQLTTVTGYQELSEFRQVEQSAERRVTRPVPAPSLWGGRGRRKRRALRGATPISATAGSEGERRRVRRAERDGERRAPIGARAPEPPEAGACPRPGSPSVRGTGGTVNERRRWSQ